MRTVLLTGSGRAVTTASRLAATGEDKGWRLIGSCAAGRFTKPSFGNGRTDW
ncbi:MAG: hypothetical protein ACRYG5_16780 [Janthinobacterium lividum]